MNRNKKSATMLIGIVIWVICATTFNFAYAEDGYRLWLRYEKITDTKLIESAKSNLTGIIFPGDSPTLLAARNELQRGLTGLLGNYPSVTGDRVSYDGTLVVGTPQSSKIIASLKITDALNSLGAEGYLIQTKKIKRKKCIVIAANNDVGVLYGIFHFLRILQTGKSIENLAITSTPKIKLRLLNHWDNLDRYVERGYAGYSLWNWHLLPEFTPQRYTDYARTNASIGINGTVLTNVNANSMVLTERYLKKVKALADIFRPYGIKVYLTARFSAPVEIGGLTTADPLAPDVKSWWKNKADEIYQLIPDFGGFLVKANSEGQPGPQNYGRNHADGANMLADAVGPHGGVIMWRAFVYDNNTPVDRAKQAYDEFKPLDGKFRKNVLIQVKNGAIDFQPREPFHPMFGTMPKTPLMMEFQVTQEYLGQASHLVFLAPLWKEVLESDTYAKGQGSTVAKVVDGTLDAHELTGIAGVSNIGNDRNWCGHQFHQANWFALGRLAWDHSISSEEIADDWLRMTFSQDENFIEPVKQMMLKSRQVLVDYMTPLGLHHIMGRGHHYGPGPWVTSKRPEIFSDELADLIMEKHSVGRADWSSVYYHRADSVGIGFDRSPSGSNAVEQYHPHVAEQFGVLANCPEKYLLWFHHVPWDYKTKSGRTLWNELCFRYYNGAQQVGEMRKTWDNLKTYVDSERFQQVQSLLKIHYNEARWWRNACLLYFQAFSKRPVPAGYEHPDKSLEYYINLTFPYAPGN